VAASVAIRLVAVEVRDLVRLVVLHQPELARRYSDRIVGLLEGTVTFDRKPDDVEPNEISNLYRNETDGD